jgi:hypothetical protein
VAAAEMSDPSRVRAARSAHCPRSESDVATGGTRIVSAPARRSAAIGRSANVVISVSPARQRRPDA